MSLCASPAVKNLKKQADEIGSIIGQSGRGLLSAADVADVIASEEWRQRLCAAFSKASQEVGEDNALKTAIKAAKVGAEPWVRQSQTNILHCYDDAEGAIRTMVAR